MEKYSLTSLKAKLNRKKTPRAKDSCINFAMTEVTQLSLSATPASPEKGLLKLPNEIMLIIISYLRPTNNPINYLTLPAFRPHCPFYADTSRSYDLRSLARTCRRLNLVTEMVLPNERRLERDALEESRATANWILECHGSRRDIEDWLESTPADWRPPRWGKEKGEEWALRKSILKLEIEATWDTDFDTPSMLQIQ